MGHVDPRRLTASGGWVAPYAIRDEIEQFLHGKEPHMSAPRTYVKKPVAIRAIRWTGENTEAVQHFVDDKGAFREVDPGYRHTDTEILAEVWDRLHSTWVGVKVGQWIIEGVQGEHYPCDPDVFTATYEEQA